MYDRPTIEELVDAVRMHLESNIVPEIRQNRKLYFQTLVAINVLKIISREMHLSYDHAVTEWHSLNKVEDKTTVPPVKLSELKEQLASRNRDFAQAIRRGDYDRGDTLTRAFEHIKATTRAQLEVANPRFLKTLASEQESNDT